MRVVIIVFALCIAVVLATPKDEKVLTPQHAAGTQNL